MRPDEYRRLDGTATADLVRRREVIVREVAEAADAVIAEENPTLGAVVRRVEADFAGTRIGPMTGAPFFLKDIGTRRTDHRRQPLAEQDAEVRDRRRPVKRQEV